MGLFVFTKLQAECVGEGAAHRVRPDGVARATALTQIRYAGTPRKSVPIYCIYPSIAIIGSRQSANRFIFKYPKVLLGVMPY